MEELRSGRCMIGEECDLGDSVGGGVSTMVGTGTGPGWCEVVDRPLGEIREWKPECWSGCGEVVRSSGVGDRASIDRVENSAGNSAGCAGGVLTLLPGREKFSTGRG